MLRYVALHEDCCSIRIEADCEQCRRKIESIGPDDSRVVRRGQRMEIDDAVEGITLVLAGHPLSQCTEIISEVDASGWLDAGQHTRHFVRLPQVPARGSKVENARSNRGHYPVPVAIDVSTPVFEGPFDLLLHLILREQVDIYEISLSIIVDAYLTELERMQSLDLDVATEFLLIAATLVELKARRLLPGREDVDLDEELGLWEERDLLLARLLECKTFKDVGSIFSQMADRADLSYPRRVGPDESFAALMPDLLEGVAPIHVMKAYVRAMTPKPTPRVDLFHVSVIRANVADALTELLDELPRVGRITFRRLTTGLVERMEIIVRFLALLELFKQGIVELEQPQRFGEIDIVWIGSSLESSSVTFDEYEG